MLKRIFDPFSMTIQKEINWNISIMNRTRQAHWFLSNTTLTVLSLFANKTINHSLRIGVSLGDPLAGARGYI